MATSVGYGFAQVVVRSGGVALRFDAERGDRAALAVQLQCAPDDWFGIGVVRRVVAGESWSSDLADQGAVEFLHANIEQLCAAAESVDRCTSLAEQLRVARSQRADEIFGPIDP